jgi:hypothetical protein
MRKTTFRKWSSGTRAKLIAILGILGAIGPFIPGHISAQAASDRIELFKFEEVKHPNPDAVIPRKWNWEIRLTPEQSRNRFRIAEQTRGNNGVEPEFTQTIFGETDLQKNLGDIIHFKLYSGDDNPSFNHNKKGNVGLGISFSRVSGGFGSSNWIVLPGRIVKSDVSNQNSLKNSRLVLVSIDTMDSNGNAHTTDLLLEQSR